MSYDITQLREYAALTNTPAIFILNYTNEHAVLGKWVYQWLIDFVRNEDPVAFHPFTLRLVREKLQSWVNPLMGKNDYLLFLEGVFGEVIESDVLIVRAIQENKVLFLDKARKEWELL